MNPGLSLLHAYPFTKLQNLIKGFAPPTHLTPISLSIGEPQHACPSFVLEALTKHALSYSKYPTTQGTESLREVIRNWLLKRFHLSDQYLTGQHILPVSGTREALFSFAQCVINSHENKLVIAPNPFYQIYEGAALLAGAKLHFVPATKQTGYKPDFASVSPNILAQCKLLYLCSPHNPTGATYTLEEYKLLIELAIRHDFIIASDECYSEIYFDENKPPIGLLQAAESLGLTSYKNCVCFHSLSKRSNLPGLRSGFVAGDKNIIQAFLHYRTYHGAAMPIPVQEASKIAWQDEKHVIENRIAYRTKFTMAKEILHDTLKFIIPEGAFYIWPELDCDDETFTQQLYQTQNVLVLPGSFLSREVDEVNPGKNHIRIALVADINKCNIALERIKAFIQSQT